MSFPQPGIFALGTTAHAFAEYDCLQADLAAQSVGILARASLGAATIRGLNVVVGVRPSLWNANFEPKCAARDFDAPLRAPDGFAMPATQSDLWVWLAGASQGAVFDGLREITESLGASANLARSVSGFAYGQSQDLTGFEDGTENPPLGEASEIALFAPDEDLAGASLALVQLWEHDLGSFRGLGIAAQEAVIGRHKVSNLELDEQSMPVNAHVAKVSASTDDGAPEIYRRSVPWGDMRASGLNFVAFTNDQSRVEAMLAAMVSADGTGRDALTFYTTPRTGAYYLIPSLGMLATAAEDAGE